MAAQTFRTNPSFDTEEAITTLKTGEALVSFLDEHGAPSVVERATILPPQSYMGAISQEVRRTVIEASPLNRKYADEKVPADDPGTQEQPTPPAPPAQPVQEMDPQRFKLINGQWYYF